MEHGLRLVTETMEFCARHAPRYYPVSVCGYHIRESGANPVQEIAYAYCIARAYIQETLMRGLRVDDFAERISFNFDIFGNLFEQVAKFRAARRLWATILRDEFGAQKPGTMQMKMIAGGGGGGLTIEQPENNIVRGAYYALISALSGAQTMALCSYDEAYTIPTEKAALISLRTMQILVEEMGLCDTADPLGGSYYIEWLTTEMEKRIVAEMARVEVEMGGMVRAVSEGAIQREVAHQAWRTEQGIQAGSIPKVGVNKYRLEPSLDNDRVALHEYKPERAQESIRRTQTIRASRDQAAVSAALDRVREAARQPVGGLMPVMMAAVKAYATLGEITNTLKQVFGAFQEPVRL